MGEPTFAQEPVYYDSEQGQYYTNKNQKYNYGMNSNPYGMGAGGYFGQIYQNAGVPNADNPYYQAQLEQRNYLGNPYSSANLDRFKTNAQATPYAELTNLFPSLNASLMQNSPTSLLAPTDTQSSGAGRFLAPSNTSQGE